MKDEEEPVYLDLDALHHVAEYKNQLVPYGRAKDSITPSSCEQ